jgi:4,5-DOPA dioxygenase extradiol
MAHGARMPAVFLGHGSPTNALEDNAWTRAWALLGESLPRPRAVLAISAHWYTRGTAVTAEATPRTIHDFGGFPRALYEVEYPAPGAPELAARVVELLAPESVAMDVGWGLDHGTWSVLIHAYPAADVPVVQLSLDATKDASRHFALAERLAPLRDEGVLIVGSGDLVHNLRLYAWHERGLEPYDWAVRFEIFARERIEARDFAPLVAYTTLGRDAALAVPTPDHYLPLLYVLAQHRAGEPIAFPVAGWDGRSVSMLGVQMG